MCISFCSYLGLMRKEFFLGDWLKSRQIAYMGMHLLILPLVDFYVTACDWLVVGAAPPRGLAWLLIVSFCNGIVSTSNGMHQMLR